ncbi:MAG: type II secretion system protein [Candidatus Paceibacterota bacterium]
MRNKGFTLIEAIVALAIFIAVSSALAQIIIVSIQSQTKIVTTQNMFNQAIFTLDKMGKEIRMAKKDATGNCVGKEGNNFNATTNNSITFLHYDQEENEIRCKKYALEDEKIKEYISDDETNGFKDNGVDITGDTLAFDLLSFKVLGDGLDDLQPRITIAMKVKNAVIKDQPSFHLQTTVSQRRLDLY